MSLSYLTMTPLAWIGFVLEFYVFIAIGIAEGGLGA